VVLEVDEADVLVIVFEVMLLDVNVIEEAVLEVDVADVLVLVCEVVVLDVTVIE